MRFLIKFIKGLFFVVILLTLTYFLGPKVEKPNLNKTLPKVSSDLVQLESEILEGEKALGNIKPGNAARIIWFDSVPSKTPYSIVYLHGWSASIMEGDPLHRDIAKHFGCNLFLPRLAGHGLNEKEPMLDLTADDVIASAKKALAVAKRLGDKVIVMATSTGGTLALHLAGSDKDIAALMLYSPNIAIYDENARLLDEPWGLQLVKLVKQSDYHEFQASEIKNKFWTTKYRVEALTHLQALVENTMTEDTFRHMTRPAFVGYYYKNEEEQDKVVSVPAILAMYEQLGTPPSLKRKVAFPNAQDHVMTSSITSKDLESVFEESVSFLEEVINLEAK